MSEQTKKQKKGKKGKKRWLIVLAVLLVLLAAFLFMLGSFRGRSEQSAAGQSEATVSTGSISVTTEGSGYVEAASTRALALEYDGKLETIYVEKGDEVTVGQTLALYDRDALDSVIETKESELAQINSSIAELDDTGTSVISAPVGGRVKRIYASEGDLVSQVMENYGGVAEISADAKLKVEFDCAEGNVSEGDPVTVEFDSWSVSGTVVSSGDGKVCVTIADDTEYKVDTEAVVYGRSGTRLGSGKLQSNHPYLVTFDYGTIDEVNVTKETLVSAGDTMFELTDVQYNDAYLDLLSDREELVEELHDLKAYQKNPVVVSEYDGYIASLDVLEGMPYEKGQQFCTIADTQSLHLKVEIDELDIDGVQPGQTATVTFDAFEDEEYEGVVEKISGVGTNSGGVTTYTVTISMDGNQHLKDAMSATAKIVMDAKDNVLLVPVDAVETTDGTDYVQVLTGSGTERREVELGLMNNEYAEVLDGLTQGEQVLVAGKESEGTMSFIMQQRMNGGMMGMQNGQ